MRPQIGILLLMLLTHAPLLGAQNGLASELRQRYVRADTEAARMQVAIDAINRGVICNGCQIGRLDEVFSTHFSKRDKSIQGSDSYYHGAVFFGRADVQLASKRLKTRKAPSSADPGGWYLGFKFSEGGMITNYYLTNVTKAPF